MADREVRQALIVNSVITPIQSNVQETNLLSLRERIKVRVKNECETGASVTKDGHEG